MPKPLAIARHFCHNYIMTITRSLLLTLTPCLVWASTIQRTVYRQAEDPAMATAGLEAVAVWVIGLAAVIGWVWGLILASKNKNLSDGARITCIIFILLLPVIGLLIYFLMASGSAAPRERRGRGSSRGRRGRPGASRVASEPGLKVCPQCAEEVKRAAKVCRFCNHSFVR